MHALFLKKKYRLLQLKIQMKISVIVLISFEAVWIF